MGATCNAPLLTLSVALEVGEILDTIVLFLDERRDLFVASLVCKTWSPIALDHLWRTLDSVAPLCMLLGPLIFYSSRWVSTNRLFRFSQALIERMPIVAACLQRYTDTIVNADWTRFEFCSRKVRRIDNSGAPRVLGPGTLAQVVNSRPTSISYILPRVAEIHWKQTDSAGVVLDLILLLSPTLKSLALEVWSYGKEVMIDTLVVLRHLACLPGLKLESLGVKWLQSIPGLEDAVCDILDRHQDSLKSFSDRSYNLNERLLNSLMHLVNLVNLELKFEHDSMLTEEDFNEFSNVLASRCPGLKKIRFWDPFAQKVTFYAIRPLTRIKGLRGILAESRDLDLKVEDFREMGDAWRSLVVLGFPNSGIPLPWFATIAEHFSPTLEYINVEIQVPRDLNPDCTILTPFTFLKRISFIKSAETGTLNAVGSFFCQLVASDTVVECAMGMGQPLRNVTGNSVKWEEKWVLDETMTLH
ncbi:hypothetical protein FRC04_002705 [Tulasnella sp. 424]|nr:hypothetical protein FRC04_002705 [Tulasnella sp. 424]KAG8974211.1 hypothetical protein FRC05_007787 [Tulasnella sp. 425]